jgi:hypothetical protein
MFLPRRVTFAFAVSITLTGSCKNRSDRLVEAMYFPSGFAGRGSLLRGRVRRHAGSASDREPVADDRTGREHLALVLMLVLDGLWHGKTGSRSAFREKTQLDRRCGMSRAIEQPWTPDACRRLLQEAAGLLGALARGGVSA